MIPVALDTADAVVKLVRERISGGARFAWLFGDVHAGAPILHYVLYASGLPEHYCGVVEGTVESLGSVTAAARWHEREAHDRFGIEFSQLFAEAPPVSPLDPAAIRRRDDPETSAVIYGPVRSGIGESASWLVETAGEDFLAVTPSMFYKHRGLEDAFVGKELQSAPLLAEHVSGPTSLSHAAAFCRAVEREEHADVPERARAARAALVECERIHQHLDALAKLADDGSLAVGYAQTMAVKERMHRLLAEATGSRFGRGTLCVGGLRFDAFASLQSVCAKHLDAVERATLNVLDILFATQSLLDRLIGTGKLSREIVEAYGGVGPLARGSGHSCDARLTDALYTSLAGEECLESAGDAISRALVRRAEIVMSFRLIRNALDAGPDVPYCGRLRAQNGSGIGRVESPQGELLYFVRFDGGLARVAIRSASLQNWGLFAPSLAGNIFTDFSFIEHSFGLLQSEVDR